MLVLSPQHSTRLTARHDEEENEMRAVLVLR
jgi:hypothetical protein